MQISDKRRDIWPLKKCRTLGDTIVCDEFVKDIEGFTTNGKTKLQQGRKCKSQLNNVDFRQSQNAV